MKMWSPRLRKPIIQSADGLYTCAPIGNLRLNTRRANVLLKFLQGHRISIGKYGGYELIRIPPQIGFARDDGTTLQFNWNEYERNKRFIPASKAGEILTFLQYAAAALDELKRAMTEVYSAKDNDIHHHHPNGTIHYLCDDIYREVDISAAQIHADTANVLENTLLWLQRDVNEALGIGLVTRASDNAIDVVHRVSAHDASIK